MFFNCTSCSTRLELPDEQVANRVLKVRCTGCGTVMVVRDPATNRSERPSETPWFYAIAGQQRGPVTPGALKQLVASGELDARTFVWAAGMAQWLRAGEVPALSSLFAVQQAPPPLPPPVPPATPAPDQTRLEAEAKALSLAQAKAKAEQEAKAKAEQEAKTRAEQETKAKAEQEAKAKAEQEAKAKAEQEAKTRAEQETKAKAEQDAKTKAERDAKTKAEQEAKAKAEQEAKAKAEQEAKAKAEQEAKAKAEQEAKAKAEQEAKAKAEKEAKAKAEQEAKAKAEQEAQAKAEQEAKAKAEQEAKAKAEQEAKAEVAALNKTDLPTEAKVGQDKAPKEDARAEQARVRAEQAKLKAEQIARTKAEVDAKVRIELEAKAAADKAEQELRDAVSQALAAAQTIPETAPAPTSITHHIEENFFSSPPAPVDIFANLDEKPDQQEMADFRKTLRAARPEAGPRTPTRAEMRALAQEFSVVTKLEQHKKKHGLWIGIGAAAAAAIVAVVLLLVPRSSGPEFAANDEGFEAFQRRLYNAPEKPAEPEIPSAPEVPEDHAGKATTAPNKRVGPRKDPKAGTTAASKPGEGESKKPISAEKYAALTQDSLGKSEFKLDFDAGAAAKKAADEAAAKKSQKADELSAEVASAFGKKKAQFAKCSDDLQERIRVVFTVSATGKVSGPEISGTKNSTKSQCIQQILERSIFPAGDSDLTYSQVLVL